MMTTCKSYKHGVILGAFKALATIQAQQKEQRCQAGMNAGYQSLMRQFSQTLNQGQGNCAQANSGQNFNQGFGQPNFGQGFNQGFGQPNFGQGFNQGFGQPNFGQGFNQGFGQANFGQGFNQGFGQGFGQQGMPSGYSYSHSESHNGCGDGQSTTQFTSFGNNSMGQMGNQMNQGFANNTVSPWGNAGGFGAGFNPMNPSFANNSITEYNYQRTSCPCGAVQSESYSYSSMVSAQNPNEVYCN